MLDEFNFWINQWSEILVCYIINCNFRNFRIPPNLLKFGCFSASHNTKGKTMQITQFFTPFKQTASCQSERGCYFFWGGVCVCVCVSSPCELNLHCLPHDLFHAGSLPTYFKVSISFGDSKPHKLLDNKITHLDFDYNSFLSYPCYVPYFSSNCFISEFKVISHWQNFQ